MCISHLHLGGVSLLSSPLPSSLSRARPLQRARPSISAPCSPPPSANSSRPPSARRGATARRWTRGGSRAPRPLRGPARLRRSARARRGCSAASPPRPASRSVSSPRPRSATPPPPPPSPPPSPISTRSRCPHCSAASARSAHGRGSPPAVPRRTAPAALRRTRRRRRSRLRCRLPAEGPRTPRRRPWPSGVARVCPRRALTRRCQLAYRTRWRHMRHSRQRRGVALRRVSFLALAPRGSRMGRDELRWGTPPGLCLEHVSRRECL